MNNELFKNCQKNKIKEIKRMYDAYNRMEEFFSISQAYGYQWTYDQYNAFWSWYNHSNVTAEQAYFNVFFKRI